MDSVIHVSNNQAVLVLDEDELDMIATAVHARMRDLRGRHPSFESFGVGEEAENALQRYEELHQKLTKPLNRLAEQNHGLS